jgi:SAM-dependent methyltransferase
VTRGSDTVVWHDVECAAYDLDLFIWRTLAEQAGGAVLDIGAGTGRVALDLAKRGYDVTAVDLEPDLVNALGARARKRSLVVHTAVADARSLDLGRSFALAIAPMQVFQLMGGREGRHAALRSVRRHLSPGGVFAIALADPYEGIADSDWVPPVPDLREEDGWVYASTPLSVKRDGGAALIERHRQSVSPKGDISEWITTISLDLVTADEVEADAASLGFIARERAWVPESDEWTGSTVVMLEAAPIAAARGER